MANELTEGRNTRAEGEGPAARETAPVPPVPGVGTGPTADSRGFLRRYRLPLALAAIALCLYAGSIVYILYGRGQIS